LSVSEDNPQNNICQVLGEKKKDEGGGGEVERERERIKYNEQKTIVRDSIFVV
jgi:hypothetical protein